MSPCHHFRIITLSVSIDNRWQICDEIWTLSLDPAGHVIPFPEKWNHQTMYFIKIQTSVKFHLFRTKSRWVLHLRLKSLFPLSENSLTRTNLSDSSLIELSWEHVGYQELLKLAKQFANTCSTLVNKHRIRQFAAVKTTLGGLKEKITRYLKDLYTKKRTAATHLLVFMISDEQRNQTINPMLFLFSSFHTTASKIQLQENWKHNWRMQWKSMGWLLSVSQCDYPCLNWSKKQVT